jgi:hypothetical protein
MLKRLTIAGLLLGFTITPISAQKVEVSGFAGWAFSDGVSATTAVLAPDGNVYDRIDPKDSGIYGFSIGVIPAGNAEFGFLYSYQGTKLLLGGTNEREIGDMGVSTYHGYFGYNWGETDAKVRPYAFFGLGATTFGDVDFTFNGVGRTISGATRFSTTWGGGVKVFPAPHFGVRAGIRMTPTYIKSDSAGWWCDPFWGCYVVGDTQYSNQVELSGGVTVRF